MSSAGASTSKDLFSREAVANASNPASTHETLVRGRRNEAIDVIRLLSAASIIYIHATRSPVLDDSRNFFRFAVPFFLFASLYYQELSMRKHPERRLALYLAERFRRLYLPFLAWSVIYLLARNAKRIFLLHLGPADLEPGLLWKGTEYHLWFLPFLLMCSVVLALIHHMLEPRRQKWRWLAIAVAVMMGFVFAFLPMPAYWNEVFDNPTYAYVQFWRSVPAACWAIAFALFMTTGRTRYVIPSAASLAGVLLAVGCSIVQVFEGILLIPRALTGFGLMLAALGPWEWPTGSTLARLGRYGYGIYLCHVLIVELIRALSAHAHFAPSVGLDLLIFIISLAGSVLLTITLGRSRWLRWLNG